MRYNLIFLLIINSIFTQAQISSGFPPTETFIKVGYSNAFQAPNIHFISTDFVLYINKFGGKRDNNDNYDDNKKDNSKPNILGELLLSFLSSISATEINAGLDATIYKQEVYLIPKIGFIGRPLYYGKLGITASTIGINFVAGASFPIQKYYLIEILYQSKLVNFKGSPYYKSTTDGISIGIQLPIYIPTRSKSKNKKLF
jgi:hypothetical protein